MTKIDRKCKYCGKTIGPSKDRSYNKKYCSLACAHKGRTAKNTAKCKCLECGEEFVVKKSWVKRGGGKYCTTRCYVKSMERSMAGSKNPNYKGGKSRRGGAGSPKSYRKGQRNERKTRKRLEADGYTTIRSGASKGIWDILAYNECEWRVIQVKTNGPPRPSETETIHNEIVPANTTKEIWVWYDYIREPEIEVVR